MLAVRVTMLLSIAMRSLSCLVRRLDFHREDEIIIVMFGSNKCIAAGVWITMVLFASGGMGTIALAVAIQHQMQHTAFDLIAQPIVTRTVLSFIGESAHRIVRPKHDDPMRLIFYKNNLTTSEEVKTTPMG